MKKPWFIFIGALINALGINALLYAVVFLAKSKFGASGQEAGNLMATYSISYGIMCMGGMKLLCRLSPRQSVQLSLILVISGCVLATFAPSMPGVYAGVGLTGLSVAFFWPALMGWMSQGLEGKELGRVSSIYNSCVSLGAIASPLIAGVLSDLKPFYAMVFNIILYVLFFIYFKLSVGRSGKKNERTATKVVETEASGRSTNLRYACWFGVAATWFSVGFLLGAFPLALEQDFGMLRTEIGVLQAVRLGSTMLVVMLLGCFSSWQYNAWQVLLGHLALGSCMLALGFVSRPWLLGCFMSGVGLFQGQAYVNSQFHGVAGSKERTKRMTIHEGLICVGMVVGSVVCGFTYDHASMRWTCVVCAAVMLAAAFGDAIFIKSRTKA